MFQWFVAPGGRKVGSLMRGVRSHLARWEIKNCTQLWREAHMQVQKLKTPLVRNTFGSCNVEKVHAVVARSTFPSKNGKTPHVQTTLARLEFRCRFIGRCRGLRTLSKVSKQRRYWNSFNCNHKYTRLHYTTLQLHSTPLHYTTPHYTPLHSTTLYYTTLHYATLRYTTSTTTSTTTTTSTIPLGYNYTTSTLHYTTLHYTSYSTLHYYTIPHKAMAEVSE